MYAERLGHLFVANGTTGADKKRAILLSEIGDDTYKLLSSLLAPTKPGEKSFNDLVTVLKNHFSPMSSEIMERFKFNTRFRIPGESIATYVSELRSTAKNCNYGDTLKTMLRDQIMCGVNGTVIHHRLLAEKDLDFKKAMEVDQGMETAATNVQKLTDTKQNSHAVNDQEHIHQTGTKAKSCYHCGNPGHYATTCKYKDTVCRNCGKLGHLQKVCHSNSQQKSASKNKKGIYSVEEKAEVDENPVDEETLFNINTSTGKTTPWNVVVYINNVPVSMQIDTGASVSIMSETTFKEYWPTQSSSPSQIRLCSYSGESIAVVGSLQVNVVYISQTHTLPLVTVKGSGPTLMGRNWLQVLSLDWQETFHLHNASNSTHSLHSVLEKHPEKDLVP